ncbi:transthyretin isoform X2 [Nelusetta ayraudi]|uniref:transthyretin isoform X2 n=1 Tax=Nelusetta ayraudi TaxID=303726 RepID=UPI003F721E68
MLQRPLLHLLLLAALTLLLCDAAPVATTDRHGGSDTKCPLTVKILDAMKGTPAGPLALTVYQRTPEGGWVRLAHGWCLRLTPRVTATTRWPCCSVPSPTPPQPWSATCHTDRKLKVSDLNISHCANLRTLLKLQVL